MKRKKTLSALVIAHNEEKKLESCLKNLLMADELIVVLDKTSDNSKSIAKKFKCKIIEGSWDFEGVRRNYGLSKCKGDWILEIDADEHASDELIMEIKKVIQKSKNGYFLIPFDNYVGKKRIRYGWGASWGVSSAPRLSARGFKKWNTSQCIHPSLELKGEKYWLKNRIKHFVDDNINDMLKRLIRYTDQKAIDIINENKPTPPLIITIRRGLTRFFKCYITRKGYKEGKWGFLIAVMALLYIVISYLKADLEKKH